MTVYQCAMKRTFDVTFALIGCVVMAMPMLIIAVVIKVSSQGNVLFSQKRIGRHGKSFTCYKFRTMYANHKNQSTVTTAHDKRITPLGKILRKFKLDELPQLWNVLIGKMSFVGPRPDVSGYADMLTGEHKKILCLRPGITGPATLYFRNEEELLASVNDPKEYNDTVIWPKKVELNIEYINSWSFIKDVGYILVTIFPVMDCLFRIVKKKIIIRKYMLLEGRSFAPGLSQIVISLRRTPLSGNKSEFSRTFPEKF